MKRGPRTVPVTTRGDAARPALHQTAEPMSHDELTDPATSARLQALIEDIARRLRPVCGAMPDAEFRGLVERMARTQYKYEMRAPEGRAEGPAGGGGAA